MGNNKDTLSKILHIIITILTALAATLTTQSCMKHRAAPSPQPESFPLTAVSALADLPATEADAIIVTRLTAEDTKLLLQVIDHERTCGLLHSSDTDWPPNADEDEPITEDASIAGPNLYNGEHIDPPR